MFYNEDDHDFIPVLLQIKVTINLGVEPFLGLGAGFFPPYLTQIYCPLKRTHVRLPRRRNGYVTARRLGQEPF
jgi:hypothetical protein